jgi:hypothetical protein
MDGVVLVCEDNLLREGGSWKPFEITQNHVSWWLSCPSDYVFWVVATVCRVCACSTVCAVPTPVPWHDISCVRRYLMLQWYMTYALPTAVLPDLCNVNNLTLALIADCKRLIGQPVVERCLLHLWMNGAWFLRPNEWLQGRKIPESPEVEVVSGTFLQDPPASRRPFFPKAQSSRPPIRAYDCR